MTLEIERFKGGKVYRRLPSRGSPERDKVYVGDGKENEWNGKSKKKGKAIKLVEQRGRTGSERKKLAYN